MPPISKINRKVISSAKDALSWIERSGDLLAFDTETTGLNYGADYALGASFYDGGDESVWIPSEHITTKLKEKLLLKHLIGHNFKFDQWMLFRHGEFPDRFDDTEVMAWLLDETRSNKLKDLSRSLLDYEQMTFSELLKRGKIKKIKGELPENWYQLVLERIPLDFLTYATDDAICTYKLFQLLEVPEDLYPAKWLEYTLLPITMQLEATGMPIDCELLGVEYHNYSGKVLDAIEKIYQEAGTQFNINSDQQLAKLLQDQGLPVIKKTPKGAVSVDKDVLKHHASNGHKLSELLLEHRHLDKVLGTYINPFIRKEIRGRILASYHQNGATTGRYSSSKPNMQNIPEEIRHVFKARPGWKFIVSDHSQIELRVLAHFSKDENLLSIFERGGDIHREAGYDLFGDRSDESRQKAKKLNFAIIYGMGPDGLAEELGIYPIEAAGIIKTYFYKYPKVNKWVNSTHAFVKECGYVETLIGRKRRFYNAPNLFSMYRQSANAVIQGSAADILKMGMINTMPALNIQVELVGSIHDELVFHCPDELVDESVIIIRDKMCDMQELGFIEPALAVDIKVVDNWKEGKK